MTDPQVVIAGLSAAAAIAQVVVMVLDRRKPNGQAPVTPDVAPRRLRVVRRGLRQIGASR